MSKPMLPVTVQRLAFIRYLYQQGLNQAQLPEPLSGSAILSFHDAVEQFLRLAADHLSVSLSKAVTFAGYWKELEPSLPSAIPGRGPMDRLNDARVKLKHHGVLPSRLMIEQYQADVISFFTDASPLVFGVDFATVDMLDLVGNTQIAQAIRGAATHADLVDFPAAMAGLSLAFDGIMDHYSELSDPYAHPNSTPFALGPTIPARPIFYQAEYTTEEVVSNLTALSGAVHEMQRAMRVTALGINFSDYVKFTTLTPVIDRYMDGAIRYTVAEGHRKISRGDFDFARSFVIESALRAAAADATLQRVEQVYTVAAAARQKWPPDVEHRVWTGPAASPST